MSVPKAEDTSPASLKLPSTQKSGIRAALEYTGIPASWLSKRPKLPSRNWLIFLSVTSSIAGLYIYDRQQCKKIRRGYIDRVKHLADEPLSSMDLARKVKVYGSKWPGDEDYDRSLLYFRKYVKPILVAAAVDYEMVNGKRHGDLTHQIADEIKSQRRIAAGLDILPESLMPTLPSAASPEVKRKRELDGGIVIIGRQTFKEYMAGLKRGWTDGLERIDKEELLARDLEDDGRFDEVDEPTPDHSSQIDGEPIPTPSRLPPSNNHAVYSPIQFRQNIPPSRPTPELSPIPPTFEAPPSTIPPLPPLLLVSFTNYIGFTQIPIMIWDFFNQRHKVRSGAEAAYSLIQNATRPFIAPFLPAESFTEDVVTAPSSDEGDLDFDKSAESYYKSSLSSIPDEIEKARAKYYEGLPSKLETARALSRGTREPTKDENRYPPPTEVELRAERMKKELRWRKDVEGWDIVKPDRGVAWDERFRDALRVFIASRIDGTELSDPAKDQS